jgi:hypothetical protein
MGFIVTANSGRPGEGSFREEKPTRKAAVETAVGLVGQGMEVTITDEAGRVFQTSEFGAFFRAGSETDDLKRDVVPDCS